MSFQFSWQPIPCWRKGGALLGVFMSYQLCIEYVMRAQVQYMCVCAEARCLCRVSLYLFTDSASLASKLAPGIPSLHVAHLTLTGCWRSKLPSSRFHSKQFNHWPSPQPHGCSLCSWWAMAVFKVADTAVENWPCPSGPSWCPATASPRRLSPFLLRSR